MKLKTFYFLTCLLLLPGLVYANPFGIRRKKASVAVSGGGTSSATGGVVFSTMVTTSTNSWSAAQTFSSITVNGQLGVGGTGAGQLINQSSITAVTPIFVVSNDMTFQTTVTVSAMFPAYVYNSTNAVNSSTNALNGLGWLDHNTSTTGGNGVIFLVQVPDNYVSGSTPALVHLSEVTTGYMDLQTSWVLSFATVPSNGLVVSTGLRSGLNTSDLTFAAPSVVNLTGIVGSAVGATGGSREWKTQRDLPGLATMVRSGNCVLAIQAVRDGLSPEDTSNSRTALYALRMKWRVQQ